MKKALTETQEQDFISSILNVNSELYYCFAPITVSHITDIKNTRRFFEDHGSDFSYTTAELKKLYFYYFGMLGYTPDTSKVKLYWFIAQIISCSAEGPQFSHLPMFFAIDSLQVDKDLIDFFDIFPVDRFVGSIKQPVAPLDMIVQDVGVWGTKIEPIYLKEIITKTKKSKKDKKN